MCIRDSELAYGLLGVDGGVERLDGRQAFLRALFRKELRIGPLNLGGVLQHDGHEIACGEGGVDVSGEPIAAKVRQVAAMIDVRMTEQHAIDLVGLEGKVAVAL